MLPEAWLTDENEARCQVESLRWPEGLVCPHCGARNRATALPVPGRERRQPRAGIYQCNGCRRQFSVTVGTIFESSKLPLRKWLHAIQLMCCRERGWNALEIQSALGLGSYRTARRVCRRIRWALEQPPFPDGAKNTAAGRKPIRIPFSFEDALRGFLAVKPEPRDQPMGERAPGAKLERRRRPGNTG
jgi:transposase-like protein